MMLAFVLGALAGTAQAAIPNTLREIHALAVQNYEAVGMAESRRKQAEERKGQALGTLFPNINARYNYTEIDPLPGPGNAFTRTNQYSALVNLNQPLFRAAAYPAYRYTKEDAELQARLAEQTELDVWSEVAAAYYDAWMAARDVENLKALRSHSEERVRDLRGRANLGRSRRGDLLQAEAQLKTADSDINRSVQLYNAAIERLTFIAGSQVNPVFGDLPMPVQRHGQLGPLLEQADKRPDILARAKEIELADARVSSARAGHMPSADFNANYYFKRTGVTADSRWDIGVAVVMPIFQGGTVNAQVKEALEKKREATLAHAMLKRQVERDVRILWNNALTYDQILKDLKTALSKAEETYKANRRDFGYGLVTSLDVSLTLNQYIDARRGYERAVLEKELTHLQLGLATGVRP